VWKTVESLDGDFYNRTLVDYLTDAQPPPASIPSAVQAELQSITAPEHATGVAEAAAETILGSRVLEGEEEVTPQLSDIPQTLPLASAPSGPAVRDYLARLLSPDEPIEQKESIIQTLASQYQSVSSSPPTAGDRERLTLLMRVLRHENERELGEAFQSYLDARPGVEDLIRAWTQLDSYARVCEGLGRDEILSVLERADVAIGGEGDLARAIIGVWEGRAEEALRELESTVVDRIDKGFFRDFLAQRSAPKNKISVSVTDISTPTAYSSARVARPRELEFVIAVEDADSPGFILQRTWAELERLQSQTVKAFPKAGTATFPRALLPTPTYKTSNELVRGLEGYLLVLLTDPNYSVSAPVQAFFSKERATRGGGNLNLWGGVNRQLAKGGDFATKGLSTLSQTVSRPLNGLVKRPDGYSLAASGPDGGEPVASRSSVETPPAVKAPSDTVKRSASTPVDVSVSASASTSSAPTPRARASVDVPPLTASPQPAARRDALLTPQEFDTVLSASISLLEEAYDVQEDAWSVKRTVLRLLETLLRTSYSGYIAETFASVVESANTERIAGGIEGLTESFWPNGEWWTPKEGEVERTEEDKERTKREARRLLLAQAPEGLKIALGAQGQFVVSG
jgi:hypothetical protein